MIGNNFLKSKDYAPILSLSTFIDFGILYFYRQEKLSLFKMIRIFKLRLRYL